MKPSTKELTDRAKNGTKSGEQSRGNTQNTQSDDRK